MIVKDTENTRSRQIEFVTCSGHGKNGALCVLQRTIRPDLVTAFELPGCRAVWTVYSDILPLIYSTNVLLPHLYIQTPKEEDTEMRENESVPENGNANSPTTNNNHRNEDTEMKTEPETDSTTENGGMFIITY